MARGKTAKAGNEGPRAAGRPDRALGLKIRTRRLEIGMSQSELADKLGISFQQIQKYEKGVNRISVPRLGQIADAMECDISVFTGGTVGAAATKVTPEMEFVASKDGHDIIVALMKVRNQDVRRSLIALTRTLAEGA